MKRDTAEWLACMLIASVGLVYCLWVVPYIPMQDGPQHLYSAHVENHFSDAGSIYPDYYRILPQFAGKGFALVYGPLESFLPWRTAARVTFSMVSLAFAWGFALVVLALDKTRRPLTLLGFVIALPWSLYMGFFAYVVGSTVGLYTLAFVLRRPLDTNKRRALLALMLLVQGVCHIFTAVLTGLALAGLTVARAPKGERLRELGRMAIVGLPAAGLLALTFLERNLQSSGQILTEWSLDERPTILSRWIVPGPSLRGWLVIALMVAGIGITLARARAGSKTPATPTEKGLAIVGLGFLFLAMFAPIHIPGWQLFAPRFAILATVCGLALVRIPDTWSPALKRVVMPVLTLGCLASSAASAQLHHRLADGCSEALAGLDAPLHFNGPRLPVLLDGWCGAPREPGASPVPGAAMAFHVYLLYFLDHGGVAPRIFNGAPSIHAIAFRGSKMPPPPDTQAQEIAQSHWLQTDDKLRRSVLTELAANGMPFEGIHVTGGRPTDFKLFEERGYVPEFEQGSLFIGRFEGCPSELLLPAGSLDKEPLFYEYGLFSRYLITAEPSIRAKGLVSRDIPARDGMIHVPLAGRPCGELWIRVVWDADGSGTLTPGDRTCEGEHWEGRLRATVTRDRPSVSCVPRPIAAP